jgi:hypothetical protein
VRRIIGVFAKFQAEGNIVACCFELPQKQVPRRALPDLE